MKKPKYFEQKYYSFIKRTIFWEKKCPINAGRWFELSFTLKVVKFYLSKTEKHWLANGSADKSNDHILFQIWEQLDQKCHLDISSLKGN